MKFYYAISNNGDGSASVHWYESEELASCVDEHQYEGWGEDCSGSIEFDSIPQPNPKFEITTAQEHLEELEEQAEYDEDAKREIPDFKKKFKLKQKISELNFTKN